jgi:hypothetical protein
MRVNIEGRMITSVSILIFMIMATSGIPAVLSVTNPPQTFQANAVWGSPSSPIVASPGSSSLPLYITITNLGPNTVSNFSSVFNPAYPLIPVNGQPSNPQLFVPAIAVGASVTMLGFYGVASNASQGVYNETMGISYFDGLQMVNLVIGVSVAVLGPSLPPQTFQANAVWGSPSSPIVASPGSSSLPLYITITNLGPNTVGNLTAVFQTAYPLIPVNGQSYNLSQSIPLLATGASLPMIGYYSVASNASQGVYNENVSLYYSNGTQMVNQTVGFSVAVLGPSNPNQYSISVTASFWGSQQSPMAVEPGMTDTPFTLYLTNFGTIPAQNVTITLDLSYPFSSSSEFDGTSSSIHVLPPTATLPVTFYLSIASNSPTGVYTLPIEIEYSESGSNYTFNTDVQLPVTTLANLTVQSAYWGSPSSPTLVGPGTGYATLVLNVRNVGDNNAYNTSITIHLAHPFYHHADGLETEETTQLGVIPAGSIMPATFTISVESNISTGEYPMNITLDYNGGIAQNQTVYVPVLGSPDIVVQSYAIQQGNAYPGDSNVALSVYLVNSGNLTANNVKAELLTPPPLSPSYPGSDLTILGTVPPAQPLLVKFFFNVPSSISSPLNLEFPLRISYGDHEYTYYMPLMITGISYFTESTNVTPIDQGSSNVNIPLLITNVGNSTAKSINAQLLLPNEISGTTFTYLGNMVSNASNMATFAIDVSSSAPPSTYYGTLRITWMQDNAPGRQFSQDIPLAFQVHQSLLNLLMNYLYIVVIVIVVIAAVIIVLRRRK